jgi:voltage-gated potassium channel Kch
MPSAAKPILDESWIFISDISPLLIGGVMLIVILTNHALFAELASYIHTRFIAPLIARQRYGIARPFLYLGFLLMLSSHLVEISIWGYVLSLTGLVPDLHKALFFSASTYTTLGYGNDIMPEAWNAITAVIALSGMFSIAWTTSFLIGMVAIFHDRKTSPPPDSMRKG